MSDEETSVEIGTGLIRNADGTFGAYVEISVPKADAGAGHRQVVVGPDGQPARFDTKRDAEIAAFDALQDTRRLFLENPPPDHRWTSPGEIERCGD